VPARPLAVLLAAGALALLGSLAGLPGLALVLAVLLAPAALVFGRVRDWLRPAAAPLLGVVGAAPAMLAVAARRERAAERAALAGLAWAWVAVFGGIAGRALGVPLGSADPSGWAGSGPTTLDALVAPMLTPTAIAIALTWIGGAILLGLLLDAASPAGAAVGSLIWAGAIVALLGAAGEGAAAPLLAPALLASAGWAIWDRAGRPALRRPRPAPAPRRRSERAPRRPTGPSPHPPRAASARPRRPRNPAAMPLADGRIRATRTAAKHVRAALHSAGSHAGLP
jgi:hypothetical protein